MQAKHLEEDAKALREILAEMEASKSSESSNPKKRLRSDTERDNLLSYVETLRKRSDQYERWYRKANKERSENWRLIRDEFEESLCNEKRHKDAAIRHAAEAIREKDEAIRQRDNALDTKCQLCEEEHCFMGKICANDCQHRCCILCMIDLGFNNHHSCPWCRGDLSSEALLALRRLDRKLATPVYLSRPTTPRNQVLDSLHFIMQGQLPELTPQQVSRR